MKSTASSVPATHPAWVAASKPTATQIDFERAARAIGAALSFCLWAIWSVVRPLSFGLADSVRTPLGSGGIMRRRGIRFNGWPHSPNEYVTSAHPA